MNRQTGVPLFFCSDACIVMYNMHIVHHGFNLVSHRSACLLPERFPRSVCHFMYVVRVESLPRVHTLLGQELSLSICPDECIIECVVFEVSFGLIVVSLCSLRPLTRIPSVLPLFHCPHTIYSAIKNP